MDQFKGQTPKEQSMTFMGAMMLAGEFGFIIAVPLLVFVVAAKWLNGHYHTHFFILPSILLALVFSILILYRKIKALRDSLMKK